MRIVICPSPMYTPVITRRLLHNEVNRGDQTEEGLRKTLRLLTDDRVIGRIIAVFRSGCECDSVYVAADVRRSFNHVGRSVASR